MVNNYIRKITCHPLYNIESHVSSCKMQNTKLFLKETDNTLKHLLIYVYYVT